VKPEEFINQETQISIDKEGTWFYNQLPIVNRNIYLFFNKHIEPDDVGGYILRIGGETCRLFVEDTPYVVVNVERAAPGSDQEDFFTIRLNDETEEKLDLETFYISSSNIPYCRVKKQRFPARFLRSAYYSLAHHIHQGADERFYFLINKKKHIVRYA